MPQPILTVDGLVKRYGDFVAVDHVSFEVCEAEIFGLLGPNGAGKTTTIRAIMDIIKPDEGSVAVFGGPPAEARERVGYLPEERGLYRDLTLVEVLVYLAELKGTSRGVARERAETWLARVELDERAGDKVKDLSRGMQQKLQFAATLIHDPDLLILDEPFQGLDPVNVGLLKRLIRELQAEGKTIALSAHQMNLVEELCDRIVLINEGRVVLYGALDEIKAQYAPDTVRVRADADFGALPGVTAVQRDDGEAILSLNGTPPQEVLRALVERGVEIRAFEVASAPLEDIFVQIVGEGKRDA